MQSKNHAHRDGHVTSLPNAGEHAIQGRLTGIDDEGRLLFCPDDSEYAHPVSIGISLADDELIHAARLEKRALVLVTSADPFQGVLIGLLRERVGSSARSSYESTGGVSVTADGEVVRFTAQNEIELRCGKARLLLHKDGRIEMSGTNLVSRSRGPVKIKGASIALN